MINAGEVAGRHNTPNMALYVYGGNIPTIDSEKWLPFQQV